MTRIGQLTIRCPVSGKRAFGSRESAEAALACIARDPDPDLDHGGYPESVYRCPDCGWFHLTRQKQKAAA